MRFADRYKMGLGNCDCIPADCWPPECPPPAYQPPTVVAMDRSPVMPVYAPPPPVPQVAISHPRCEPGWTYDPRAGQCMPPQLRGLGATDVAYQGVAKAGIGGAIVGGLVGYAAASAQRKSKQRRASWALWGASLGALAGYASQL